MEQKGRCDDLLSEDSRVASNTFADIEPQR